MRCAAEYIDLARSFPPAIDLRSPANQFRPVCKSQLSCNSNVSKYRCDCSRERPPVGARTLSLAPACIALYKDVRILYSNCVCNITSVHKFAERLQLSFSNSEFPIQCNSELPIRCAAGGRQQPIRTHVDHWHCALHKIGYANSDSITLHCC